MQFSVVIRCEGCKECLGEVRADTADMAENLHARLKTVVLAHREDCEYYGQQCPGESD